MRTTLIIGAASGLGRLWATRAASAGARVVLADRDAQPLDALAHQLGCPAHRCDITLDADVDALFEAAGPVDRVVLTAAIMPTALALEDDPERIRRIFEINLFGAIRVLRTALAPMVQRGHGEAVVFGSVAGEVPTPHMSAYAASKAALAMYVETLQMELDGTGVSVRLVLPPMTDTPLLEQARTTSNPRSFEVGRERGIVARPEAVVDAAMVAVNKGKLRVYPHRMARVLHFARRWFPRLLARAVQTSERS